MGRPLLIALCLFAATPALAQVASAPSDQNAIAPADSAPAPSTPLPADAMLNAMLHATSPPIASAPTTRPQSVDALSPVGSDGEPIATNKLIREGSAIIARKGRLERIVDSPYPEFLFETSGDQMPLQPMLVLPNLQLMSMESAISATKADLLFTVSGTVTESNGKNYILLEPGPDQLDSPAPPDPAPPDPAPRSDAPSADPGSDSADRMLDDMLASARKKTADSALASAQPTSYTPRPMGALPGAVAPGNASTNILRERSWIMDRAGRLQRSQDGQFEEIVFDADGSAMQDPPFIILPNLKLQALENAMGGDNHDPRFMVTGTVTEYRGKNYILLQKVVVMPVSSREF